MLFGGFTLENAGGRRDGVVCFLNPFAPSRLYGCNLCFTRLDLLVSVFLLILRFVLLLCFFEMQKKTIFQD
jgi:hypothetical protein